MEQVTLSQLEQMLNNQGFDSAIIPPNDVMPFGALGVSLGGDHKNRERSLLILLFEQLAFSKPTKEIVDPEYCRLEFQVELPIKITTYGLIDLARAIAFINSHSELPGLEMDEIQDRVRYRYSLLSHRDGITEQTVMSIIGVILLQLDLFTEMLEQVALGKQSLNDLLKEAISKT